VRTSAIKRVPPQVIAILLLLVLLPLELGSFKVKIFIYATLWISLPFIVSQFLPSRKSLIKDIILAVPATAYILLTCFFALRIIMCRWSGDTTLYLNKKDKSLKVIGRRFGCYGTDDDYVVLKKRTLAKNIYWVTKFSEEEIDSSQWKQKAY
jgi:hypothetical protein